MKKLSLLLAGVMFILSMTACTEGGGKAKDTTAKVTAVAADTTAAENTTIQTENSTAEITTTNTEETTAKTESASLTTKDSHISIDNSTEVTYVFDNCAELNAWIATISDDTVNKVNAVGVEKNAEYIKTFIRCLKEAKSTLNPLCDNEEFAYEPNGLGNINILISDRTYEPWIHYNVKWLSGERVDIYTTPIPPEKQAELEGKDFLDYSDSVLGRHINFTGDTETWWKETIYIGGKDIVCLVNMEVDEPRCRVNFLYEDIAVQITLPKSDFENGFLNKLSFK